MTDPAHAAIVDVRNGSWAMFLVLVLTRGLGAAAETALRSVSRARIVSMMEEGHSTAVDALRLMDRPAAFLAILQTLNAGMFLVAGILLAALSEAATQDTPWPSAQGIVLAVVGLLALAVGDLIPRALAARHPERIALVCARWLVRFGGGMRRASWTGDPSSRSVGARPHYERSAVEAEEEIKLMAADGVETGQIEPEEHQIIRGVLMANDKVVREVMVPRIDITAVSVDGSIDDLLQAILKEGHSRIPIYEESIDQVLGIVHLRDLLGLFAFRAHEPIELRDLPMRKPYYIPESKRLLDFLNEVRASKTPIAIVVDEYGGTAGLVTLEDILEEIVGEITDESDIEEEGVRTIDAVTIVVPARVSIEEVNELIDARLPEEEFETIGGFVFGQVGQTPEPGLSVDYDGLRLTVEETEGHRIRSVRITRYAIENDSTSAPQEVNRQPIRRPTEEI